MYANKASNNKKCDNVKIIRIALDLHDVIVDSRRLFSLNVNSFLYLELETGRGVI